jgi:hypothetical protein
MAIFFIYIHPPQNHYNKQVNLKLPGAASTGQPLYPKTGVAALTGTLVCFALEWWFALARNPHKINAIRKSVLNYLGGDRKTYLKSFLAP